MNRNNYMARVYNSRLFWILLSLIAALAFWVYVTSQEADTFQRTFRGVQLEVYGEETLRSNRNMAVTDLETGSVTVVVTGPRRVVAALDAADLKARVDVSKLSIPTYTAQNYSIIFPDKTDMSGITVDSKTPETVNFRVSSIVSKTIQVRGSFDGSVAANRTAEMPQFDPAVITVTGPEAKVGSISYAWVSFGAENIETSYQVETQYSLMNEDGAVCSKTGLTLSDETVVATLSLLEVKEVPLTVNLNYGAGATEQNTVVTIEPSTISIAGDSALLEGINKIVLADIDLTRFESSYSDVYPVNLSDGVRNLSGINEAKVTVELHNLTTKTFKITNFSYTNITEGFEAEIVTTGLDVVLRGSPEDLAKIKSANLRAVADLTDYDESVGTFLPLVKVYVDGYPNTGVLGDYTITIEIRRIDE